MASSNVPTGLLDVKNMDLNDSDTEISSIVMDCILMENVPVQWSDVAGLGDAKEALTEAVILPIQFSHLHTEEQIPCRRVLLIDPPGTGKTYLAKAVASQASNASFFFIASSDLVSRWMGKSEKLIRSVFELALARQPSIICIDDVDMLCLSRLDNENVRKIKNELLISIQEVGGNEIFVIGATNAPWLLDADIRTCFEKCIRVPLPEENARLMILKQHLGNMSGKLTEECIRTVANNTKDYSGADIVLVARDALMQPVRKIQSSTHFRKISSMCAGNEETIPEDFLVPCSPGDVGAIKMSWMEVPSEKLYVAPVTTENILESLSTTKPSIDEDYMKKLDKFMEVYGQSSLEH
ncbi:vacuolar protein sorting-associated protein 4B isoform X1 [Aedes aegypti]|uniref:AAA+ ATPase domain-containing protein n=1 Tax=Aedes aegypti TaxID=7159 RepID=A0A8W7ISI3_AEDAE|nr:vacuolar protein sorting-associated protein 4B isoform X1 [Aedes aegypti]XP_021712871.1 vacuolar protein sorting-associated protein 4B isoform X1 [Aedes aegypti]